jgi:hypothetical protein
MKLVRTIPRLGALPEMFGFYCAPCNRAPCVVFDPYYGWVNVCPYSYYY